MNSRILQCILIVLFALTSKAAMADKMKFGAGLSVGNYTVNDPVGPTESTTSATLSLVMAMPVHPKLPRFQLFNRLSYTSFELDTVGNDVAQDVSSLSIESMVRRAFPTREMPFKPFIGAGIGLGFNDYKNRLTLDKDQFVDEVFSNRSTNDLYSLLSVGLAFKKNEIGMLFGAALTQRIRFGDDIDSTELGIYVLY